MVSAVPWSGPIDVDLYSDTKSRPTAAMRRAMADAEVGDEQAMEDPTVNRLCESVADLLGKEAAVFLPSGTMCNEIAIRVHCRPGDEVICEETCHIVNVEGGGPAALSGVMIRTVAGDRGVFAADQVSAAVRPVNRYMPRSRLVAVEQTANLAGGTVWPVEALNAVGNTGRSLGLATHMDGARLLNAVVATGRAAAEHAAAFDSVWIDFSKGLGAPVGAALAGRRDFIEEAWRYKQQWGGAMRQAGIIAAAALHALMHHVDRLAEDHENARFLAGQLAGLPGIRIDADRIDSNIVFFEVVKSGLSAPDLAARVARSGIRIGAFDERRIRCVTHLDVDRSGIEKAAVAIAEALG